MQSVKISLRVVPPTTLADQIRAMQADITKIQDEMHQARSTHADQIRRFADQARTHADQIRTLADQIRAMTKIQDPIVQTVLPRGPAPVPLGKAAEFAILSKTGISTVPASAITGHVGVSPAAATYLTGFSLVLDPSTKFSHTTQVIDGHAYGADYDSPDLLTKAIADLETAYTDASNRINPDFLELTTGRIGGLTLTPGLYKWTSGINIATDITLSGGVDDTWIFQTTGTLVVSSGVQVLLAGGAQAKNIVWQVAEAVSVGTKAHLEGILLAKSAVTFETGSSLHGRILTQTHCALQQAVIGLGGNTTV
jgi:hypothetical protein